MLVMAGGAGTRLWPASTAARPKHLVDPLGVGMSLLRATIERAKGVAPIERSFVVTTQDQHERVAKALPELAPSQFILEPVGRNTAPCIALSVVELRKRVADADASVLVVLPADHHIADAEGFVGLLKAGVAWASEHNRIVTLGIEPDRPATGFGYIERADEPIAGPVSDVVRFVEKPDLARAREFLQSGRFLWNAGIFVMPVRRIAEELERHCPATWNGLHDYANVPAEPIDTAVMEKQTDLVVIPARVGWTDLGSWASVYDLATKDGSGNAVIGPAAILEDATGCLVWSDGARVGAVGVQDLVIVHADGKLLVCPRDRAQDVRRIAQRRDDQ